MGGALLAGSVLALALMPSAVRSRLAFPGREIPGAAAELPRLMRGESARFRLLTWEQTARMVREFPLTGHGMAPTRRSATMRTSEGTDDSAMMPTRSRGATPRPLSARTAASMSSS